VTLFIVTPVPSVTEVIPAKKFVPPMTTSNVWPNAPVGGTMLVTVGPGDVMLNAPVRVAVPPPGAGLVTVTFLAPGVAVPPIVIPAVTCVPAVFTVAVFTVIPSPKLTVLTPSNRSDPPSVTLSV
jgi:hypothetical protein